MSCLSVTFSRVGGSVAGLERIGGATVGLSRIGGLECRFSPVCSADIGPDVPANVLFTVSGIPLVTADGYYLIVATS